MTPKSTIELRPDDEPALTDQDPKLMPAMDEVIATNVDVTLEMMSDEHAMLLITSRATGTVARVEIGVERRIVRGHKKERTAKGLVIRAEIDR